MKVVTRLREHGFTALWAGGCVRDMVLGREPKDFDVATDATPDQVIAAFEKSIPVGAAFGVVRVVLGGHEYEVATFRIDGVYTDGRRPTEVRWAEAREDALRRDFTINGMFYDPIDERVVDYVAGREDLERRVIRAIGEPRARFAEDYLRLLRCVRFAARLEFAVDAATWDATVALAPNIVKVSNERIKDELDRMLADRHRARAFGMLVDSGLLGYVLPELHWPDVARQRLAHLSSEAGLVAAWATACVDTGTDAVEVATLRLRASRAFQKELLETMDGARRLASWEVMSLAQQKRLARRATFRDSLHAAHAMGLDVHAATRAADHWDPNDLRPRPLLTGDVLAAHGFRPGPAFKAALEAIEDAQLEGRAHTLDDALALARTHLA